jgi:DNA-binding NtrC family response regulator
MHLESALIIQDEPLFSESDKDVLERTGIPIIEAADVADALSMVGCTEFSVLVINLSTVNSDTLQALDKIRDACPDVPIILCNGADCMLADTAIGKDVFEVFERPVDIDSLVRSVQNAARQHQLMIENRSLIQQLLTSQNSERHPSDSRAGNGNGQSDEPAFAALVGNSSAIEEVRSQIAEVASTDMTVLIEGETGTGKDVVARLVHQMSFRSKSGAFVKICCPAVPEQLLESELFGHETGAFTGAQKQKPGRLELASCGSVFLDEIGDMPAAVQAKLLEVLEHKLFTRLGGTETIHVDARILAAANTPLLQLCDSGGFRKDLYYRLSQYTIHIPPLRERVEDVPLLVDHFLSKYGAAYGNTDLSLSFETMSLLMTYSWPGNVRELESVIRRFALCGREEIILSLLQEQERQEQKHVVCTAPSRTTVPVSAAATYPVSATGTYQESERRVILDALARTSWNRRRASDILGISYNTLRRRIALYELAAAGAAR